MRQHEERRQLGVRIGLTTFNQLEQACLLLKRSQGQIVEEALKEFFETHGLAGKLTLNVGKGYAVLTRVYSNGFKILDVKQMNGVPPTALAEQFALEYGVPVTVTTDPTGDGGQDHAAPGDQAP